MRHHIYTKTPSEEYPIVYLVPTIKSDEIDREYLAPFGIDKSGVMVITPYYDLTKKKTPSAVMKEYINTELKEVLDNLKAQFVFVADAEYFKVLTGVNKADANLGYVMDSAYGAWKVIYIPSYRSVFYDPEKVRTKIAQATNAVVDYVNGVYKDPGESIIKNVMYPKTDAEIKECLQSILDMKCPVSSDIEAFGLKHHDAGIGTITICWDKNSGIAFPVDYVANENATEAPYGTNVRSESRRELLRWFFESLEETVLWHQINYDVYVLIYQLYMKDLLDREGLLKGSKILLKNWHDTKLITYLATNTCAGNKLGLKEQAQEYAGNYAMEEIKDITKIPLDKLLEYNLVDGLSTWFVYEKHWDTLNQDNQRSIYDDIFKPAIEDIIDMQLTGMPLNRVRVLEVEEILEVDRDKAVTAMINNPIVQEFTNTLNEEWVEMKNTTLKKKRVTLADAHEQFNPNSGPQIQKILYTQLGLPILSLTANKQPSTDGDVLKDLRNHTKDPTVLSFLNALLDYNAVNKILTTYITAFLAAPMAADGWCYLYGNFNLGGTLSGRLSGSNPNLQNIPANSKYAKLIKSCFQAPPGWLFCGLDYSSLEDKISGLTTRDPNKLKVYQGEKVYDLVINGVNHHIRGDAIIRYDGKEYTGDTFYGFWNTNRSLRS